MTEPWPQCCVSRCKRQADVRMHLHGENIIFKGALCSEHFDAARALFSAAYVSVQLLRAVSVGTFEGETE